MNDQNLIPNSQRSPSELREQCRKGGINSGKSRRRKKTTAELVNLMLSSKVDEKSKATIKKLANQLTDEDCDVNTLMIAGQVKSAVNGNVKAFECLQKYNEKGNIDNNPERNYTVPILDITRDYVDCYRAIHEALDTGKYREVIIKGGRGGVKSNFVSAIVEEVLMQDPQAHAVFTRRYKTDLRGSVFHQFQKTIIRHDRLDDWEFTTSPMMARYKKTGQCVLFVGADKPISLKSYNLPFGYVKLLIHEECDEMAGVEQMDNIEDTFLRADTPALDIKIYNPPKSVNNFMNAYTRECETKESTYICHSYYYNVPEQWLGKRFFERAEWFKQNKPTYYANNYLGEVTGTGGAIFENIEAREITDAEIDTFKDFHHGLDFGYEHPQVFIKCHYDYENDIVYPVEEIYSKRCKNSTFARKISKYKNVEVICDSARPDNIAEMRDWGFDATGAVKRWQNKGRAYSWEWLQQANKIVIDPQRTPQLYKELTTLEFEQLRDGSFSSEYPTLNEDGTMALIYSLNRVIMEHTRTDQYNDNDTWEDMEDE